MEIKLLHHYTASLRGRNDRSNLFIPEIALLSLAITVMRLKKFRKLLLPPPALLLTLFLFLMLSAKAQYKDAQLWQNIYLEKKLNSTFTVTFNEEGRIRNNVSEFNYVYTDLGFLTKINKHIRASLDYLPLFSRSEKRQHIKHQYYAFLKYKVKPFKHFTTEVREMYQEQYSDINSSVTGDVPEHLLRSKLVLKYNPFYYPWNKYEPYMAFEAYYLLDNNAPNSLGFNRNRYFAGVFYEINKRTYAELYYMIEVNYNQNNPPTNYVMGVGFERDL